MNEKIVIIGAGKTGRGFLARLLTEENREFVLIDEKEELIRKIKKGYEVAYFNGSKTIKIIPKDCVGTKEEKAFEYIAKADVIFTAVGIDRLEEAGKFLNGRTKENVNIFLCENGDGAIEKFKRGYEKNEKTGLIPAAVFCTTIEAGKGENILSETFDSLPCAGGNILEPEPDFRFLEKYEDFNALMIRKLFTYNAATAVICYNGIQLGYESFAKAANDERILALLKEYYEEIGRALCREYGYSEESQRKFAENSLRKFTDKSITDSNERNGRDPARKLGPTERLIGPLKLISKYGGNTEVLEKTIASCLRYDLEEEWSEYVKSKGAEGVLREICGLDEEKEMFGNIVRYCRELENGKQF